MVQLGPPPKSPKFPVKKKITSSEETDRFLTRSYSFLTRNLPTLRTHPLRRRGRTSHPMTPTGHTHAIIPRAPPADVAQDGTRLMFYDSGQTTKLTVVSRHS